MSAPRPEDRRAPVESKRVRYVGHQTGVEVRTPARMYRFLHGEPVEVPAVLAARLLRERSGYWQED
jgi:hypothetical protein